MKIEKYATDCHRKYYLKAHLVFVCKYRKKLLQNGIDTAIICRNIFGKNAHFGVTDILLVQ